MLTLHHLNDSRSQRIIWLLEELGAPYELTTSAMRRRGWRRRSWRSCIRSASRL